MLSLKKVMAANATSCVAFGALFALQPNLVANFLAGVSPAPELYIVLLGILLIVNGFHLIWASTISMPSKLLVLYFSAGDYLWVIGSIWLMISRVWITTLEGIIVTSAVAVMVGLFGLLQMTCRKAMGHC